MQCENVECLNSVTDEANGTYGSDIENFYDILHWNKTYYI